ncbi:unnamed protein product (macronuclear) [Paramecium tetraurelia]|uniref:Uncharacterized protein n=1 Tax=Paramecium tetraurelia TaxID=5888 RepID=A0DA66_PARTE|nr:uncharacterized protein GSPATT00014840001 [Paramecium tetraurelia]CAK79933.1 unnamed protein product [Paramecium tetraurelia]|eukprot:XP_001447330.1 hypothetical protein (macronuclear) [Paramecium tetraurelia strain d4-2]
MADNDDYEIQYYKYLEKIGMTPPNPRVRETPLKQSGSGISQRLLFQNSSLKKELNYQRINSIIVLNNQLEINLANKQSQPKLLNITSNSEGKSPIFDIQTSLIQSNEQKNEKGLSQIDEFADEYQQEASNKTNCYESKQEQNNDNINLDFSSLQLKPLTANKLHEEAQQRAEQQNQLLQESKDFEIQTSLQNNLELNEQQILQDEQSCQQEQGANQSNQEPSKQDSPIIINTEQNQDVESQNIQLQSQMISQNEQIEKINSSDLEVDKIQILEPQPQVEKQQNIEIQPLEVIMQEQIEQENHYQPQTSTSQNNIIISQQEPTEIQLEKENDEIDRPQIQVSDNNIIINEAMEIEKIQIPHLEEQIVIVEKNNLEFNPPENKQNTDQENCNNNINQQQVVEQKLIEKKKKKQKKSRIINKKKKKEKKNKVEKNEQTQNNEKVQSQEIKQCQSQEIKQCEEKQISQIEEKLNNEPLKVEQEQKNPICNLLQSLIQGFYGENIKINWHKYTFLRRKIQKKRSILLKSKLLI